MSVREVLDALASVPELNRLRPGASDADIAEAERALGRPLPGSFRELYRTSDGCSLLDGNLNLHPLTAAGEDDLTLVNASGLLRGWGWDIPDELVMFGDNGGDENFGLWLPAGGEPEHAAVIQAGETFGDPGLVVIGTRFERFLRGWSAYYLGLSGGDAGRAAQQRLGVAEELVGLPGDGSDEEFVAALAWADPDLPDPDPDPYARGLDADGIRELLGRDG